MNKVKKTILQNADKLKKSKKTLCDIYSIITSYGENVFIECPTMTRKVTYTYNNIAVRVDQIARAIMQKLSVCGEYIGLHGENSAEWIIAFWAILKSGNKPYLVNLKQPQGFTQSILDTLCARCVITVNSNTNYSTETVSFSELEAIGVDPEKELPAFSDIFAISTSGTSLKEKICIYTGFQVSEQILNLEKIIKTNPDIIGTYNGTMKTLAFLPFYHIFGLEAVLLWYSFLGATFVLLNDLSPENILRTIRNHEVTHVFSVPILWHALEKAINKELSQKDEKTRNKFKKASVISLKLQNISPKLGAKIASLMFRDMRYKLLGESIRFCISGGSYIKASAVEMMNAIGYPLCNGYGMTEIGICSVELGKTPKERMLCSIGTPFDSLEYRIGEDGRLCVRGSSVSKTIIVDKVELSFDDWFDTGDIVSVSADGRYYISGRYSDIVFSDNGENLNPDLAEKAFSIRDALEFSVIGNDDGSKLMLVVRVPNGIINEQKKRIIEDIENGNASLPSSYRIHDIKFTFDPLMQSGAIKVSRAYLKSALSQGKINLFDPVKEQSGQKNSESEIKQIIRELFAKVLDTDIENIGDDMHFMNDLGGTSLDYFTLINELDTRFNLKIDFGSDYDVEKFGYTVNHFERLIKDLIK